MLPRQNVLFCRGKNLGGGEQQIYTYLFFVKKGGHGPLTSPVPALVLPLKQARKLTGTQRTTIWVPGSPLAPSGSNRHQTYAWHSLLLLSPPCQRSSIMGRVVHRSQRSTHCLSTARWRLLSPPTQVSRVKLLMLNSSLSWLSSYSCSCTLPKPSPSDTHVDLT